MSYMVRKAAAAAATVPVFVIASAAPSAPVNVEAPVGWARQASSNASVGTPYSTLFDCNAVSYELATNLGSEHLDCAVYRRGEQSSNVVSVVPDSATPRLENKMAADSRDPFAGVNDKIVDEAASFSMALSELAWKPTVWSDEGEIVFEWIDGEKHAVVSIEGDGVLGYTMLVDDRFVSGAVSEAPVNKLPQDLLDYLTADA